MAADIKYPVGIQDFRKLREMGYAYVDKTKFILKMLESPGYYFLSRPRRFGKSLFLSTLQAYFEGRRELFKGLALDTDAVEWVPKPIIKFSFNAVRATEKENLGKYLDIVLSEYAEKYGASNLGDYSDRFASVIRRAHEQTGQKVAVLVDEYDSLLLDTIRPEHSDLNSYYRDILKSLFSVLKNNDEHIFMAFITGVSRFSHTSLFSGANNLEDISILNEYAAVCGITEDELCNVFKVGIQGFAEEESKDFEAIFALLKRNYDGYHFAKKCPDIYNPFSILRSLKYKTIDNFWFQSGTPSYLIEVLKHDDFFLPSLDCLETLESELTAKESYLQNPVALLFESGYVTIKGYEKESKIFTLGFPNLEVAKSFTEVLLPIYSGKDKEITNDVCVKMRRFVINGEANLFMEEMKTFLQGNPYGLTELDKREKYFQCCLFLLLRAIGFEPQAERQTCNARMDMMMETSRFIYIFELKTDGSSENAMSQIHEKGYHLPFVGKGKQIINIAANYSSNSNNIESWQIEKYSLDKHIQNEEP